MKHVQKSVFEMTFTFSPVLKRKWMSRHFPFFVLHGWIWFQQRPTLASALKDKENWQKSVALCETYVVLWYMFLINACDADSFSLIGCYNLGESVGCFACTLWLDFRNLQASPQFLRDVPPTRKLQELLWLSTKTLHVQESVASSSPATCVDNVCKPRTI